jgi:hypothetical protein
MAPKKIRYRISANFVPRLHAVVVHHQITSGAGPRDDPQLAAQTFRLSEYSKFAEFARIRQSLAIPLLLSGASNCTKSRPEIVITSRTQIQKEIK